MNITARRLRQTCLDSAADDDVYDDNGVAGALRQVACTSRKSRVQSRGLPLCLEFAAAKTTADFCILSAPRTCTTIMKEYLIDSLSGSYEKYRTIASEQ